jgi:8-oxo-dGTP pyrophosphatase MutT (NUDIX family)
MSWAGLDDFLARAEARLDSIGEARALPIGGEVDVLDARTEDALRPAAVLMGIVPRTTGATLVLTLRPTTMSDHAGQVALPGGKIDPQDEGPVAAALREADEEIGLASDKVDLIGVDGEYLTGSGFRITPVLGLLPPSFVPVPDPTEVEAVFETPLDFLMNPANHQARSAHWNGTLRHYYEMPHNGNRIWGVTAGIIRSLHDRIYDGETF